MPITTGLGKCQVDTFRGSVSYVIPLSLTKARGLEPTLALSYQASTKNSIVGLGWNFSVPAITRSTQFCIPQYDNDIDIFNSTSGELVPRPDLTQHNMPSPCVTGAATWTVRHYQSRLENNFDQIEFWCNEKNTQSYWLVKTGEGINHLFGLKSEARVFDLLQPQRIFRWAIEKTWDAKGNKILYHYEKSAGEVNHYLTTVQYGNYISRQSRQEQYAFCVLVDYGENGLSKINNAPVATQPVVKRPDAFITYYAGFKIETSRLCKNIFLTHQFSNEKNPSPFLVTSWELMHKPAPYINAAQLISVTQHGYKTLTSGTCLRKSLPPLLFEYADWNPKLSFEQDNILQFPSDATLPGNLLPFRFIDLYQEGLPGILYSDDKATFFWRNRGDGHFDAPLLAGSFPIDRNLNSRRCQLMVFPENDQMGLVVGEKNYGGFYGCLDENGWSNYQPFQYYANEFTNPNAEFSDINGRGYSDLVILNNLSPFYYPSLGQQGFGVAQPMALPDDFPTNQFTDNSEFITFTNIVGDGLAHRVRVRQNSVEYWPNLGYGKFGEKVTLSNAPDFGDDFDSRCVFLADTNGTGFSDLIYASSTHISIYINLQGQAFSQSPINITLPELYTHSDQIRFVDLLGKGASCLIFTKITAQGPKQYYYDFASLHYPYLLQKIQDNNGLNTTLSYTCSVACYVKDLNQKPTPRIPRYKCLMPVHVVDTMTYIDNITQLTLTERYQFHDGCYDPLERSFVGFGYVEHWDTEVTGVPQELDAPPRYSKLWYHCGVLPAGCAPSCLSDSSTVDFNKSDSEAWTLDDSVLDSKTPTLTTEGLRQARYSLRGKLLRQEVYGLDGGKFHDMPYIISTSNFTLRCLEPPGDAIKGIFASLMKETLSYDYERNPKDPRITHAVNLDWNAFNNVLQSCIVCYPRRGTVATTERRTDQTRSYDNACQDVYPEQKETRILAKYSRIKAQIFSHYKSFQFLGHIEETYTFEISESSQNVATLYHFSDLKKSYDKALQTDAAILQRTLNYYWDINQTKAVLLNDITILSPILLHHTETLVETHEELNKLYQEKINIAELADILENQSGYISKDGNWWRPGKVKTYHNATGFYLPMATTSLTIIENSSVYTKSDIDYDDYFLIPTTRRRYLYDTNTNLLKTITQMTVQSIDYYVCAPRQSKNANQTITEVLYDPLGVVVASSTYGTVNKTAIGNLPLDETSLIKFNELTPEGLAQTPEAYLSNAGKIFAYRLYSHENPAAPACQLQIHREKFQHALPDLAINPIRHANQNIQIIATYYDGFGTVLQTKTNADPGNTAQNQPTQNRWLVSGYKIHNNKGLLIKQYLPYYTAGISYEPQAETSKTHLLPPKRLYYDALNRVLRTDTPKGFYIKTEICAWYEQHFDENDNCYDSPYYVSLALKTDDKSKAEKAALDALLYNKNTPKITIFNSLKQAFLSIVIDTSTTGTARLLNTISTFDALDRPLSHKDARLLKKPLTQPNICFTYDKLGQILIETSVDNGKKIQLYNMYGNMIYQWNNRNYQFQFQYDNWQRPLSKHVQGGDDAVNCLYEQMRYGDLEDVAKAQTNNLYGQLIEHKDQAGISESLSFDIRGHRLAFQRTLYLAQDILNINWANLQELPITEPPLIQYTRVDALGRITQHQQPDGSIYFFDHNRLKQVEAISLLPNGKAAEPIIQHIEYQAFGHETMIQYGNNMETHFACETTTQHLLSLTTIRPNNTTAKPLQNIAYQYDPVGNIISMDDRSIEQIFANDSADPPTLSEAKYQYDSLYRLQCANSRAPKAAFFKSSPNTTTLLSTLTDKQESDIFGALQEKFQYDDGNNMSKLNQIMTDTHISSQDKFYIMPKSNRIKSIKKNNASSVDLSYDAQGNVTKLVEKKTVTKFGEKKILTWNYLNQLSCFERETTPTETLKEFYYYNAYGRRSRKFTIENNDSIITMTETLYLKGYEIKRQRNPSSFAVIANTTSTALRIKAGHRCIATYRTEASSLMPQGLTYHLDNYLRSVTVEVDQNANVLTYEEFSAYGESTFFATQNQQIAEGKTYRYSKEEYDYNTGLYYYGARYYSPQLARWLSADPAGLVDGLNVYGFVTDDPESFWDEWGFTTKYSLGQHGAKVREQKRLTNQHGAQVSGSTHESEHTIGFEPLNQTSNQVRGRTTFARELENTAPAYQEVKSFHRDNIGTGTTNAQDASGFNSHEYRNTQRLLVEQNDVSSAVQINQLTYAHQPGFQNQNGRVETLIANDSYTTMVDNMTAVPYFDNGTMREVPVTQQSKKEMHLARIAAQTGTWPTALINEINQANTEYVMNQFPAELSSETNASTTRMSRSRSFRRDERRSHGRSRSPRDDRNIIENERERERDDFRTSV